MSVRILVGDVLERLAELPDESVHCVVTSPPYWGLRDYGTATWEGGDAGCDPVAGETIGFDDFLKVDIRVGTVIKAEPYPEARRPAYKVWVDFGAEIGIKKTSAQATAHYTLEGLIGRQVAAVVNFPPKQIGKFMSEILVLGFPDGAGEVVVIGPERPVPNGGRLF